MSDVKLVKVDNWGIYFLQRLKHFFNRTDYCDLTLQFQNNAQLKVHRLVLSACTEYFELLERTCEMYEDCLVMPDDLQADVVVPIVNFMYTGQLEFKLDLLESLYQTSQIMNMHVLTKLLDAHRKPKQAPKRAYSKTIPSGSSSLTPVQTPQKRVAYPRTPIAQQPEKKQTSIIYKPKPTTIVKEVPIPQEVSPYASAPKKQCIEDPRPSRYELPEEFEDNLYNSSFTNISYTSEPIMVHPETTKKYSAKKNAIFKANAPSAKLETSTLDIVECKKISSASESLFDENFKEVSLSQETEMFTNIEDTNDRQMVQISNQLFDQILDQPAEGPKITIETKDNMQVNVDHAKIISEVLKKYPHLVKSNKNIKLKILNTPTQKKKVVPQVPPASKIQHHNNIQMIKSEQLDYAYESDVLDSKEAARLIALGADNIQGPWICLICGAPGKALHFKTYYTFRRHLVDVHNEKPISKMCEYCGLKSFKRNYLLHHLYTKHGVPPPPSYHFPKCNQCNYIALTEGFLAKHKLSHAATNNFRCNVCSACYNTSQDLLKHIQATNHKYSHPEKEKDLQCIYCLKVFLRHRNLFTHLKAQHKEIAKRDGIIEESDDEQTDLNETDFVKPEPVYEEEETQYHIEEKPDGNIHIITNKKDKNAIPIQARQKILNTNYGPVKKVPQLAKPKVNEVLNVDFDFNPTPNISGNKAQDDEYVTIDNNEYIMKGNRLIPRDNMGSKGEYIISDMLPEECEDIEPSSSMAYAAVENTLPIEVVKEKKPPNVNQMQIVVSNEEEYKALMNSNQTIIFDDVDTNKTLTVLSNPHATLNSAHIELSNPTENSMMVLPDNYQLNVSQAIPADNNIMVVYSHPVSDKDKQYQIITPQGINEQFVQTSSVLTSSYEPITTSTAVLSAHVIDPNGTVTWQNANLTQVQETELVNKNNSDLTTMPAGVIISEANAFNELPEVTLTPSKPMDESVSMEVNDDTAAEIEDTAAAIEDTAAEIEDSAAEIGDSAAEIEDSAEQNIESETSAMDVDPSAEESVANVETNNVEEDVHAENEEEQNGHESCIVDEGIPLESEENIVNPAQEQCIVEDGIEIQAEEQNGTTEGQEELISETVNTEQEEVVEDDSQQPIETGQTNTEPAIPVQTKEQIESLASEWSDDDAEAKENGEESAEQPESNEPHGEMEESIENIQQEMDKQVTESSEASNNLETNNEPTNDLETNNEPTNEDNNVVDKEAIHKGVEKISSLLNDWDETDVQEEQETETAQAAVPENDVNKKDDKIKSLVSDWDEDEDATKENN